jgi:hypothetical protein
LTAIFFTHGLGEPIKGDVSGVLLYHILSNAWSVPTNFPLHYWSVINIQPLCPCILLFPTVHLYCIAKNIVPRWPLHSAHQAWTHRTCTNPGALQGSWYLTHQIPCWLTVCGQVLHCTASNIDPFKCSASTPRPLPHLPWLASLPLQLSTNFYHCKCIKWHCFPFLGIFLGLWPLKMKVLWSFKMSGNTHPLTDCHIPQNLYRETQVWQILLKRSHATGVLQSATNPPSCLNYSRDKKINYMNKTSQINQLSDINMYQMKKKNILVYCLEESLQWCTDCMEWTEGELYWSSYNQMYCGFAAVKNYVINKVTR